MHTTMISISCNNALSVWCQVNTEHKFCISRIGLQVLVFLNNRLKVLIIPKIYWFCYFIIVSDSYALFFENTNTCRPMRYF